MQAKSRNRRIISYELEKCICKKKLVKQTDHCQYGDAES